MALVYFVSRVGFGCRTLVRSIIFQSVVKRTVICNGVWLTRSVVYPRVDVRLASGAVMEREQVISSKDRVCLGHPGTFIDLK